VDEQAKGKVRNKLKDLISKAIVKGTLSAAFLFASPYIAVSEALGASGLLSFLEDVLGEELAERIKRKLGARKYSEEDVREIFEMAKKDEDVRESLAKLVNELIDEKLLEELGREKSGYLEAIYQAVDELKKELPDIKERLENLENRVDRIEKELEEIKEAVEYIKPEYVENEDDLIKELNMEWVKVREPVVSDRLKKKIEKAVEYIKEGEKVCIVGDPGIGKTTALYLACLRLMSEGIKLRTSGIRGEGVLIVDNIGAKKKTLEKLENCTTPVIASARISEWKSRRGWHDIKIEPEDQRPKLREMFISMLKANNVKYTEEAVDEVMKKDPIPVYLRYIADNYKGREISREDTLKFPENAYVYRAEVIRDCGDDLAIALLYCVAKTETGRLHFTQLDILREMLETKILGLRRDERDERDERYGRLLAKFDGSFGIIHEIDRDLMTGEDVPEGAASIIEDIDAIRRIRACDVEELLKEACNKSFNRIYEMKLSPDDATELVKIALRNFPDLAKNALEIAKKDERRDRKLRILSTIVEPLFYVGHRLSVEGRLSEDIEKLKDGGEIFEEIYRNIYLVDKELIDKELLPALAIELHNLGISFLHCNGMLDDAIEKLKEAEKIWIDLARADIRFFVEFKIHNNIMDTLCGLAKALYMKGRLDDSMNKFKELLEILELLPDELQDYWNRSLLSESHFFIAMILLEKGDERGAVEHLCRTLEILTDKRTPKCLENLFLKICILHLFRKIHGELISEECREKLEFLINKISS
jgi:tetratricopeptide (TPR) repeat protein